MTNKEKKKAIDDTRMLLQTELTRIIELLQSEKFFSWEVSHGYKIFYIENRAELSNRMTEARRDMVRLKKLLYNTWFSSEKVDDDENSN